MDDRSGAFIDRVTLQGAAGGPLSGTSFAAKDLFDIEGHVTGYGNPAWAESHDPAECHAAAVTRMLDRGATLLGKTHTDELAYSLMGVNAHYGTPVNATDPRRVPGGSSSGSAAAVAAGLVDFALGSDTGGSVRLPAAFCGIWGLRTSHGHVSLEGACPLAPSFDTVGWFAQDPATMVRVTEAFGFDAGQPPVRMVMPVDLWARASAETVAAVAPSLARLQDSLGPAVPVILAPEGPEVWREVFRICQAGEVWQALGGWVSTHEPQFGPGTRERFAMAAGIDAESLNAAQVERASIRARMREMVTEGTVLVLPTSPAPAPFLDADDAALEAFRARALDMLCPAGLAGLPQLSVPAGTVEAGPVGISLIGAEGTDLALIATAAAAGLGTQAVP